MAEVIVEQQAATGFDTGNILQTILAPIFFMIKYWYLLLLGVLLTIAIIIICYMLFAAKEAAKERDEPGYYLYKKTIRDCQRNRNKKQYSKKYSWANLLFLGLPVFMKDKSVRVYDRYYNEIGSYRGHVKSQDGTFTMLICVSSILGWFDTNIVVKIPEQVPMKIKKDGKEVEQVQYLELWRNDMRGHYVIECAGIEKTALYYYIPLIEGLQTPNGRASVLDVRKFIEGSVSDSTYQVMVQRVLNNSQMQIEKAMNVNPHLKWEQMSPRKTPVEQDMDNNNGG